ncbi:MAG: hypothetical protein R2761_31045 [Acidimicrobiales bacterium]
MDLSGLWRAAVRTPQLEAAGVDSDLDDSAWEIVGVPGHWGQAAALAEEPGPVIYRRRFTLAPPPEGRRAWLRFDGILSEAEVWLDGNLLGDTGVYFAAHRFDITSILSNEERAGDEHLLAVEVACEGDRPGAKRSITGSLQAGPLAPPGSPGGIWRPVGVDTTGPVAILRARLLCVRATEAEAELQFRVVIDAAAAGQIRIDTSITAPDGTTAGGVAHHDVASGENRLEWTSVIPRPHLWWPASLGPQPRYEVSIALRSLDGTLSDRRHWRTGLRTVEVDDFQWKVNGERLFAKGVAVGPHGRFLALAEPDDLRHELQLARDAGLDLVRVHGHVSRPELYGLADDLGLLVWQDLPLVGSYATRTRAAARAVARAAVDELGHHPSVALWCAHDEPNGPPLPVPDPAESPAPRLGRRLGRHLAPSWNRSVLDPLLRRELRSADPTRSVVTRSGALPGLLELHDSDSHLWLGWRTGRPEDLADLLRRWPRLAAFVGAIGSQSAAVEDWPPDAPAWATAERGAFERYIPRGAYADGQTWAAATRAYQADLIQVQIETLRRLKYAPAGGFCVMALFDAEPDGGFGLLDHDRIPKPAYDAVVEACRPVIVVADSPPPIATPDEQLSLAVHAVSDLRHEIGPVRVTARARLHDWMVERHWIGQLPADSCAYIGTIDLRIPPRTGALTIELELEAGDRYITNRYQTVVIPPSESMAPASRHRLR